jgi:hypothetical protein
MNEQELQDKIKDKLERKYGARNVWVNAGIAEHGVDLILIFGGGDAAGHNESEFGEELVIGIQFKAEERLGAGIAQKAVGQATVAFGHRFPIVDQHGRMLDLVYIMNYGEILPQAREYLADARNTLKGLLWFDKSKLEPYLASTVPTSELLEEIR